MKDYYKILQISSNADESDIKSAYRKLVKLYHPDTNKDQSAKQIFLDVQEAYEILVDKNKRYSFDLKMGYIVIRRKETTNTSFKTYTPANHSKSTVKKKDKPKDTLSDDDVKGFKDKIDELTQKYSKQKQQYDVNNQIPLTETEVYKEWVKSEKKKANPAEELPLKVFEVESYPRSYAYALNKINISAVVVFIVLGIAMFCQVLIIGKLVIMDGLPVLFALLALCLIGFVVFIMVRSLQSNPLLNTQIEIHKKKIIRKGANLVKAELYFYDITTIKETDLGLELSKNISLWCSKEELFGKNPHFIFIPSIIQNYKELKMFIYEMTEKNQQSSL